MDSLFTVLWGVLPCSLHPIRYSEQGVRLSALSRRVVKNIYFITLQSVVRCTQRGPDYLLTPLY